MPPIAIGRWSQTDGSRTARRAKHARKAAKQCHITRDKAQVLYSYLVEDDPLVKYAVHRYVQRLQNTGAGGFDFERETQQMPQGQIPNVGTIPLLVASGYSWETHGDDRLSQPTGRLYLFQPKQYWGSLVERLSEHPGWEGSDIHAELRLRPADETYGRAEPMEGDA